MAAANLTSADQTENIPDMERSYYIYMYKNLYMHLIPPTPKK